jgi:CBS domain-containing protein
MSPATTEAPTAAEVMRPMPEPLALESTVAEARERMGVESASFLTVVSPGTQKLLGIVTQDALEGGCASEGHEPATCPIIRHLDANADFCFEEEAAVEVLRTVDEWRPASHRGGMELPVVVVNAQKVPVGYLAR